jgi:hypothetical protein
MAKGDSFERLVPRQLSLWFTHGKRDDLYWRKKNRNRRDGNKYQLGDIICETSEGRELTQLFNIELKTGYSKSRSGTTKVKNVPWDLLDLIDYTIRKNQKVKNFVILDFWEQTTRDAKLTSRIPLLIFKRDYHVPVVVISKEHKSLLSEYLGDIDVESFLSLNYKDDVLLFYRRDEFFEWLTPEIVCVLANKLRNGEITI